eukprot:COSAG04_NODE_1598_length_6200_cov_3.034584_1_plen_95_part_10
MRVMALHELAQADSAIAAHALEDAMDEDDPKAALIALLTSARAPPPQPEARAAFDFVCRGPQLGDSAAIGAAELDQALRRLGVRLPEAELAALIA